MSPTLSFLQTILKFLDRQTQVPVGLLVVAFLRLVQTIPGPGLLIGFVIILKWFVFFLWIFAHKSHKS